MQFVNGFIGSVRRECLDHLLILNERHLRRQIWEYVAHFNHVRPHQGSKSIPEPVPATIQLPDPRQPIVAIPVLGGLPHDYRRVA
jgi:putative transposase